MYPNSYTFLTNVMRFWTYDFGFGIEDFSVLKDSEAISNCFSLKSKIPSHHESHIYLDLSGN